MPLDESILCLIRKMNVTAQVVKLTPFVTLCITSLTLVLQVYIWNDSWQPLLAVVCSKHDTEFVYRNLITEQASTNHAPII